MAPGSPAGVARRWLLPALATALAAVPAEGLAKLEWRVSPGTAGERLDTAGWWRNATAQRLEAASWWRNATGQWLDGAGRRRNSTGQRPDASGHSPPSTATQQRGTPPVRLSWLRRLPAQIRGHSAAPPPAPRAAAPAPRPGPEPAPAPLATLVGFVEGFFGVHRPPEGRELPNSTFENRTLKDEAFRGSVDLNFVRINSEGDTISLQKALILSSALTSGFLALFSLLRYALPEAYTRAPSPDDPSWKAADVSGLTDWFSWVWTMTPEQEVEGAGLDGWSVIAFYRLGCNLFSVLGFFLMSILIPLHWVYTPPSLDALSRMDIGNLPPGCPVFWVHAFMVWLVVLTVNSLVLQAHRDFSERRFAWLKDIPEPRASTLMVENIPTNFQSDESLKAYFTDVFREEAVVSAYVVRKTPKLRKKLHRLTTVKYQLLVEESRWEQGGAKQDERSRVAHYELLREEALRSVAEELAVVERAVQAKDPSVVSPTGFVTFSSEFWQRLASKEQYRADVEEFAVSMPPEPEDVQWQDLAQGKLHSSVGELVGWACIVLIFLFWSPVVAFISTLTTLENLARIIPAIEGVAVSHPSLKALVEGFLATASLKLFLSFLPNLLMVVIRRFFTLKAGTLAQLRLQRWYYSFLLLFVLLITIVGRSAFLTVTDIARNPGSVIDRLATTLPTASHFYLSYMILGWFTVTYEPLRVVNVVKYAYFRFGLRLESTDAKAYSEPEDEDAYGVGSRMGMASLMCSITLVFCSCTPLILACASVYFFLGRMTYGYMLVHAESKKPDLGGHVFFECLRQVVFVLFMYVVLMTGVLLQHSSAAASGSSGSFFLAPSTWTSPPAQPIVAGVALLAVYWAWRRLHSLAWDTLPLEEVVRASRAREQAAAQDRRGRGPGAKYVQRECDLDLLLEDAEKVANARAQQGGFVDYVRSTADLADLLDLTSQVTSRGTDVAGAIVDHSLGAVDLTVSGLVHYGATGAAAVVDRSTEAASTFLQRTFRFTQGRKRGGSSLDGTPTSRQQERSSEGRAGGSAEAAPPALQRSASPGRSSEGRAGGSAEAVPPPLQRSVSPGRSSEDRASGSAEAVLPPPQGQLQRSVSPGAALGTASSSSSAAAAASSAALAAAAAEGAAPAAAAEPEPEALPAAAAAAPAEERRLFRWPFRTGSFRMRPATGPGGEPSSK